MGDAILVVSANTNCHTDELLACHVRLQLIAQTLAQMQIEKDIDTHETTIAASVPEFLFLEALRRQLHDYTSALSTSLQQQWKQSRADQHTSL